ncbi:MAG: serine hydrolase [Bacteroidetes bacterium]|nr:serine hydrolase [Bacteroidota bacterium]
MKHYLTTLFFLFLACQLFAQPDKNTLHQLDEYYLRALAEWNVPGMAVAITTGDSIIFAKGYGVTDISTRQAVDEHTLFAVASNTKAFTAAALALLVEQNKLRWNDKVRQYLPWFALYDPYVSDQMTIRDLLTHRSGLKTFSGDLIWYGSTYSRREVIEKARYLKPAFGFREQFGYSNIMYIAAGELIPAITGQSWDDFVRTNLLNPLEMNRSTLHVSELARLQNVAQPHTYVDGKLRQIPWVDWDNMGPAGSLISSASDMARWLQMHLGNGTYQQKQILDPESVRAMQQSVTPLPVSKAFEERFPGTHFRSYGLGWSMFDYHGQKIVTHNGGYDGMISQTVLIPRENIGFVILTNALSNMYYPLMYKTLDLLLNLPDLRDWSTEILAQRKQNEQKAKEERARLESERIKNTRPSLPLAAYEGFYGSPVYDSISVYQKDGQMWLQMMRTPDFIARLTHWHYDTFEMEFITQPSLPKGFATFGLDRSGKVTSMELFLDNPDFDFTELAPRRLSP